MTGLNHKAFESLLPSFTAAYEQSLVKKEHYSGKKKRHTRKHITGSTRATRVIILTKARPGKVHDKRQFIWMLHKLREDGKSPRI